MLVLSFSNYFFMIPLILCFLLNWFFFFNFNFFHIRNKGYSVDKLKKINVFKKLDYRVFYNYFLIQIFFVFLSLFLFKSEAVTFWWDHFRLTQFEYYLYYYVFLFLILCLFVFYQTSKYPLNISSEYVFSLSNIVVCFCLLFFANTFYTAFFILEAISCFIFYKFSISKFWFKVDKKNQLFKKNSNFLKLIPKTFVNTLFFQYWSTFFSSVIMLFSLIYLFTVLTSSSWNVLNNINVILVVTEYFNPLFLYVCIALLLIGVFIKLGITPLHLYKVEIYKGMPLVSLFFYTTFFFLIYFLFFIKLILFNIPSFSYVYAGILLSFILFGFLFLISLLFNNFFLKTFFAYSSVLNSLIVFIIIINSI